MDYDSEATTPTFAASGRGPVTLTGVKAADSYDPTKRNSAGQTSHPIMFRFADGPEEGKSFSVFLRAPDATAETNGDSVKRAKANKTVSGEINEILNAFGVDPAEAAKSLKACKTGRALWAKIAEMLQGKPSVKWASWQARQKDVAGSFDTLTWIAPKLHAAGGGAAGAGGDAGASTDEDIPF